MRKLRKASPAASFSPLTCGEDAANPVDEQAHAELLNLADRVGVDIVAGNETP